MNIESVDKWLDEEYGCSFTKLEELHDFYFKKYCDLEQENKQLRERIEKIESLIKSKNNSTCIYNNEERGAYTFLLDFDKARDFLWNLENILKEKEND